MRFSNILHTSVAAVGLCAAMPAVAADAADAENASAVTDIVVTAQKRSESVQNVPAAITAVSAAELEARGFTAASDLQFLVPNMTAGTLRGETAISIRGVGLNQGSPGVAVHIDGVYQPRATMGELTQIDIERTEVLRGPQGTLYGRNANGGVVNYITQKPKDELEGYVKLGYATYDESRLQGMINVPVTDGLRTRLVVDRWERSEGFVKNVRPEGQDLDKGKSLFGRLEVEADLSESLTANVSVTHAHRTGPFVYFTLTSFPSADAQGANPFLADATVPSQPRRTAQNDLASTERDYTSFTGSLAWDLGDVSLKSITAFQEFDDAFTADFDATDLPAFPIVQSNHAKTFTQELNVGLSLDPLQAVIGAFYMNDRFRNTIDFDFQLGFNPFPAGTKIHTENQPYKTETMAVFGDATLSISDNFRLLGGLRYSKDKQRTTQNNFFTFPDDSTLGFCPNVTSEIEFESTTPRAGLQYDFSRNNNFYASFSKGFKIGGFNYRSGCGNEFDPEKLTAYEVGLKNKLFDGMMLFNASAFYYDYRNLQVEQLIRPATFFIANAPKAEIYGVEIEALVRPDDHWTFNANVSLSESQFLEFENFDSLNDDPDQDPDQRGNPLPNAPKFTLNAGIAYKADPIIAGGTLTLRGDVAYKSRIYFREFGEKADSQPGYALLSASATWASEDDKYSVRLYGKNLTGKDYYAQMNLADSFGSRYVTWGAPRQIGVEFNARF